jgi:type II secretory pathway component PulF
LVYALVAFVPKFKPFFERIEVPLATKLLLAISDFAVGYWPLLLVVIAAIVASWMAAARRPNARRWMQLQLTRIPVLGTLMAEVALTRTLRVLGSLLDNGVGLLRALDISRETAGHPWLAASMDAARTAVQGGERLGGAFAKEGHIPEDVVEMIDVAETTNRLPQVLTEVAEVTQRRVDRRLQVMLRLLEPALLVCVAGMVIFIFAALVLPMMRMSSGLQ